MLIQCRAAAYRNKWCLQNWTNLSWRFIYDQRKGNEERKLAQYKKKEKSLEIVAIYKTYVPVFFLVGCSGFLEKILVLFYERDPV